MQALAERHSGRSVAEKAKIAERTLRRILAGSKVKSEVRRQLKKAWGIDAQNWDLPPGSVGALDRSGGPRKANARVVSASGEGATIEKRKVARPPVKASGSLDEDIARQRQRLADLLSDPNALTKEIDLVEKALDRSLRLKAKFEKPVTLTTGMILKSPEWVSLMRTVIEALRPFPGAYDAVASALEASE